MTTDTVIEPTPGETHHAGAEDTPRVSPGSIATMRRAGFFLSRWLARLTTWGETVIPIPPDAPVVMISGPELGDELASSAVGVPVNYLVRSEDGWRCHWRPNGAMLRGVHSEVCAGFVEEAWADEYGVLGVLAIVGTAAHEDLCRLERAGGLGFAMLCTPQDITTTREVTPWGLVVATVRRSRAISVDFSTLGYSRGAVVVRQLARDEEPRQGDSLPSPHALVPRWGGADAAGAVTAAIDPGAASVTNPIINNNSVDTTKRQNVNSATHSPTWPSGGGGVPKSVEYSVSVSIGENYMGSWWADLPGSVTFDAAQAYGMVPVKQDTSNAKAWATTTLNIPTPTAIQGTFYYW